MSTSIDRLLQTPQYGPDNVLARPWNEFFRQTYLKSGALTILGEIAPTTKIRGRAEGIGTTVQHVDNTGIIQAPGIDFSRAYVNKTVDNINDGATYARPLATALNAGQVDLSKTGVIGPLGSTKINQNVMSNYSNNATVDSIDNGVNATVRVYGPGGPGTTWHQFIGAGIGAEVAAFSGAGIAYNTDQNVYYDGSYHVTPNGSQTLPDGIQFSGSLHTVSAGGAGGTGGGGGNGGGGGGGQRK